MKKILLASAAAFAVAGSASATEFAWSGSADMGWADDWGGLFVDAGITLTATAELSDDITATFSIGADYDNWNGFWWDWMPTITLESSLGMLKFGDLDDAGASEHFYKDRSGMYFDVENMDNDDDFLAVINPGAFGFAAGCSEYDSNSNGTCGGDLGWNFGAGGEFGGVTVGFGYDMANSWGESVMAISADTEVGAVSIGVSYIVEGDGDNSMGIEVSADVSDTVSVGGYYAMNEGSWGPSWTYDDMWGVNVSTTIGAGSVAVAYDAEADGDRSEITVDADFAMDDSTTIVVGYSTVSDANGPDPSGFWAGIEYGVSDDFTVLATYSQLDGAGAAEYMPGLSLYGSVSF